MQKLELNFNMVYTDIKMWMEKIHLEKVVDRNYKMFFAQFVYQKKLRD